MPVDSAFLYNLVRIQSCCTFYYFFNYRYTNSVGRALTDRRKCDENPLLMRYYRQQLGIQRRFVGSTATSRYGIIKKLVTWVIIFEILKFCTDTFDLI